MHHDDLSRVIPPEFIKMNVAYISRKAQLLKKKTTQDRTTGAVCQQAGDLGTTII